MGPLQEGWYFCALHQRLRCAHTHTKRSGTNNPEAPANAHPQPIFIDLANLLTINALGWSVCAGLRVIGLTGFSSQRQKEGELEINILGNMDGAQDKGVSLWYRRGLIL